MLHVPNVEAILKRASLYFRGMTNWIEKQLDSPFLEVETLLGSLI